MKNKLTTIAGFLSGAFMAASAIWQQYQPIFSALAGLAVAIFGVVAKDAPKKEE